jgi:DNA-binding beta-propeller fold protein YncE
VTIIDVAARAVLGSVHTGSGHHKIAFAQDDSGGMTFAYVSNVGDSSITPVTAVRSAVTNVSGVGASPHGIDYSHSTHAVYGCSGDANNSIEVIATRDDPATAGVNEQHSVVARVPLSSRCRYLHVTDDGLFAFAISPDTSELVRLRLSDLDVDVFSTGQAPAAVEIVGGFAYVANVGDAFVSVIDLAGVLSTVQIPVGLAVDPSDVDAEGERVMRRDGALLFVTNGFDDSVSVIDTTTNRIVRTWTEIPDAVGIAVAGPAGGTTFPR